jgi:integrase
MDRQNRLLANQLRRRSGSVFFEVPDGATATLSRRQVSEIREIKATRAWTLAEMSGAPNAVADFHAKLTIEVGPVAANHCARVIRAVYRYAMRTNRGLPLALPASGVDFNVEQRREVATRDFKAWAKAWRAILNGNRRAFHLLNLLGGFRPGELAGLKWVDVLPRERVW